MKRMTDGTIVVSVPEDDLAITGRVILDSGRWCKTFYPVEPRMKGRWVKISPANIYECSNCGKNVMTDDISEYDFCHGCGADMRQREEEQE